MMKHRLGSCLYLLFLHIYSVEYKAFLDMLSKWNPISVGHIIIEDVLGSNISLEELKKGKSFEIIPIDLEIFCSIDLIEKVKSRVNKDT